MKFLRFKTPMGLFSAIWVIAGSLHYLEAKPMAGLLLYPFTLLVLIKPDRLWTLASFCLVQGAMVTFRLPNPANHSVIALLVDICLLIGCARAMSTKDTLARGRILWDSVKGPLKLSLIIVYGFAVFHKINSSFFDPEVSSATFLVEQMFRIHGFAAPENLSFFAFSIYITLILETVIMVLLLWPRFCHLGALTGLVFHLSLGWAKFYDFATVAFALYLFFFSWDTIKRCIAQIPKWVDILTAASFLALIVTSFSAFGDVRNDVIAAWESWQFKADTLMCLFWTLIVIPLLLPVFSKSRALPEGAQWPGTAVAWLIPVLALFNGFTSYLGLKTVANFSMFSNLRTEGGQTNHLIIPQGAFFVADYQNDLVRVVVVKIEHPDRWPLSVRIAGGKRWVKKRARWASELPNVRIPFIELKRMIQLWKELGVTNVSLLYEHNGSLRHVKNAFADPELMEPLSLWERKFLSFRAVQEDGEPSRCRW